MKEAVKKKKISKQVKNYIINISILLIVTIIAMIFIFKDNPQEIIAHLANCDLKYILVAVGVMAGFFLVEGFILMILARMYKRDYPYYKAICNCMIGAFFSGITPSNSGGQFVQAYTFSKQGIKVSNAASILLMHFIVYQTISVLFSALILIFKFDQLRMYTQPINIFGFNFEVLSLSLIGFGINALVILFLFFTAFSTKLHHFIITTGVSLMVKFKLCKDREQKVLELNTKFETFRIELKRLLQNAWVLVSTSILFLVKMVLFNLVPYFVALSLGVGLKGDDLFANVFDCVSMSLFSTTITSMVPIPGASGGAELVFKMLFDNFFVADGTQINAIILIWRGITYYFGLIVGLLVFLLYREVPKKESLHGNARTLLQLRIVELDNEKKTLKMVEDDEEEEEVISVEEIEARFKKLREELALQLQTNEQSVDEEMNK